ncbi:hypothetical protein [Niastella sp. OAS944]|uniref:hypothetical protein n=1 Tax=Niastella sp. OAS944 TaxID=2664089 RepID=UPI00347C4EF6|nr:hypothetical protein [Chitinophagaceae bacterium OAS944]
MLNVKEMLARHKDVLYAKGYSEDQVKSGSPPGALMNDLEKKLSEAIGAVTDSNPSKWFRTELKGKLYITDDITYNFNYCYDKRISELSLGSVEAHYKDLWKVMVFIKPQDCPSEKEMNALVRPKAIKRRPRMIRDDVGVKNKIGL